MTSRWIRLIRFTALVIICCDSLFPQTNKNQTKEQSKATQREQSAAQGRESEEHDNILERERWFYGQREYPTGKLPRSARYQAWQQREQMRLREQQSRQELLRSGALPASALASTTQWTLIGPQPTSSPYYTPFVSGRVTALVVDPRNQNTVYLGAAEGGVWKTTDGGVTWMPLTDTQPSLAVGSITLDPQNFDTVYVGTGEENFGGDNYFGAGVLKSTNGGASWTQLPGPFVGPTNSGIPDGGAYIGSIAVQPGNSNVLLAALVIYDNRQTTFGQNIMRSIDGGVNWITVLPGGANGGFGGNSTAALFDPTDGSKAYAALGSSGVYGSVNGGQTWNKLPGTGANLFPAASVGRIAIAIAPSAPATLFASVGNVNNGSLLGLYKTTDAGLNWMKLSNTPDYCTPQCWYDNVVAVHPGNANVVYAAGAFGGGKNIIYQSLDGGTTWNNVTKGMNGASVHADFHAMAFDLTGAKFYAGSDGGVWSTTNTTSAPPNFNWANLNATLAITQFYAILGLHPTSPNVLFAGNQDNGTQQYSGSLTWDDVGYCGDGSAAAIDFNNPNNVYINCNSIDIAKSTTGGSQFSFSVVGGTDPFGKPANNGINTSDRVRFIPPLAMDPSNPQTLYFGTYRMYQTTNGAGMWTLISPDLTAGGVITAMAVAKSSSNVVYVGTGDGLVQMTSNAGSGAGATWANVSSGLPNRAVTALAVDTTNSGTVYVTFSGFSTGHVFKSTNAGGMWTDISGNLPNTPVNTIVIDPDLANTLYIGTDVGVFSTVNGGTTWSTLQSGLPNVAVLSLGLQEATRLLFAGTHGRSAWELALPGGTFTLGAPSPNAVSMTANATSGPIVFQVSAIGGFNGTVNLSCPGWPAGASCNFAPSASVTPTLGNPVNVTLTVNTAGTAPGNYNLTIAATSNGQLNQAQNFNLQVLPDYSMSISNPVLNALPGQSLNFNGTLTTSNGYNSLVTITCGAGHPSTCTPPAPLTPSAGGAAFNIAAGNNAVGTFNFNVNTLGADALKIARTQAVTFNAVSYNMSAPVPNAVSVAQGNPSQPISFQVTAQGNFSATVNLSCSGLPVGASCNFAPSNAANPTSSQPVNVTLIVDTGTAIAGGPTTLTITAAALGTNVTSNFSLTITGGVGSADLAVMLPQPVNPVPVGSQSSLTATVSNSVSGSVAATLTLTFSASVNFGALPNGCVKNSNTLVTCSFNASSSAATLLTIPFVAPFARNLTATAMVSSGALDSTPSDNTSQATLRIRLRPFARKGLKPRLP